MIKFPEEENMNRDHFIPRFVLCLVIEFVLIATILSLKDSITPVQEAQVLYYKYYLNHEPGEEQCAETTPATVMTKGRNGVIKVFHECGNYTKVAPIISSGNLTNNKVASNSTEKKPTGFKIHYNRVSYYGGRFHNKPTACGETFDKNKIGVASPVLPCGTRVVFSNLETGKSLEASVNDGGPYKVKSYDKKSGKIFPAYDSKGHLIPHPVRKFDLSERTAEVLGIKDKGTALVAWRIISLPKE